MNTQRPCFLVLVTLFSQIWLPISDQRRYKRRRPRAWKEPGAMKCSRLDPKIPQETERMPLGPGPKPPRDMHSVEIEVRRKSPSNWPNCPNIYQKACQNKPSDLAGAPSGPRMFQKACRNTLSEHPGPPEEPRGPPKDGQT